MVPVLWICGPVGVGKTEVGWRLYRDLVARGHAVGYVDIDQLGICFPEPEGDPGRYLLKSGNLAAVVRRFASRGARSVIVSGVVDARRPVSAAELDGVDLTLCRLRADRDAVEARLIGRGATPDEVRGALEDADLLDERDVGDVCIDTTSMSPAEVVQQLERLVRESGASSTIASAGSAPGEVLWFHGPSGAGKSAVGFAAYLRVLGAAVPAAFVDVDQVGFCATAVGDHELRALVLADLWDRFRGAGAERLVAVGPIPDVATARVYEGALPNATFTWCHLRADEGTLDERLRRRAAGEGWRQPGDPLRDRSPDELATLIVDAIDDGALGRDLDLGDALDTDGRTIDDLAVAALRRGGWVDGES